MKISRQKVEDVTNFTANYVAGVIRSGTLDTVCIPYFGKFQAKLNQVGIVDGMRGMNRIVIKEQEEDDDFI